MSGSSTYDCYVANLPLHYYENDIREIFGVAGEIVGVKVLAAKHGAEGKVAFVKFTSESDAHCCAQYMNNHTLEDGRTIKVRYRPTSQENGFLPNSVVKPHEQAGATGYNSGIKVPYEEDDENTRNNNNGFVNKVESKPSWFDNRNNNVSSYESESKKKVEVNGSNKLESRQQQRCRTRTNSLEEMMQVLVSHVESPLEFWAQQCTKETATRLEELTDTLENICPAQAKVIGQLSTEQMYGCKFSEDGLWYRCIVEKSLAKNEVHVRYIDYGNAEVTNRFGLVTLPSSVTNIPPLCECYQLEGLELVSNDPQSDIFDKGLDELSDLINEEKIYIKVIKKEKSAMMVKIYKDADGTTPLDVLTVLTPTGSVRSKAVGTSPSWATAVKKTGVNQAAPQVVPPKSNAWSAKVNGNDPPVTKSANNYVKPADSFVKLTHAEPSLKPASNHVKPNDLHVKPIQNHAEPSLKPASNHMRPSDSHTKPIQNNAEPPPKPASNHVKSNDVKPIQNHVEPSVKPAANHVRPNDSNAKPMQNQIKGTDPPVHSILAHVAHLESLEASLDHFSSEQPTKPVCQPPPGFHEPLKSKPEIVTLKEIVKEEEEEIAVPEEATKNLPKQKRLYSETESTTSVGSEVCKESDDNGTDIIDQSKITTALKAILLENYRHRSLSSSTSEENRCVENLLATESCQVGNLFIPGEEGSKQDLSSIACESTVIGHIEMDGDTFNEIEVPKVTANEVGGYKKEIAEIKGLVDLTLNHVDLFKNMGIKPPRGLLLFGPHGTGKTLISRAIANESSAFCKELFGPDLICCSPEVSSRKVMKAFNEVTKNAPSILIIDQIDVLAPKRKESGKKQLLSQLLNQLNQLRNNVFLIGTATRSSSIDPAVKRTGLFFKEISINKPDETNRLEILRVLTKGLELSKGLCLTKLAQETREYTGLDLRTFCTLATTHALDAKINSVSPNKNKEAGSLKRVTIKSGDFKFALAQMNSSLRTAAVEIPSTTWADLCGMESVKKELKDLINHSHSYEERLLDFGSVPSKGILMYGPHGCGKKFLAKAMSNECKCNFVTVKGYALCASDSPVDDASCHVADVFDKARSYAPSMLYIDEVDLVTPDNKLVKEILKEIDNIGEKENVYVIGSTHRPSHVHPAFRYSGRLHNLVHVPLPDNDARMSLLKRKLKSTSKTKKIDEGDIERIAATFKGFNITDLQTVIHKVCKTDDEVLSYRHFEETMKYIRPSVTHTDVEECRTYAGSNASAMHENEMVSPLMETMDAQRTGINTSSKNKDAIPNGVGSYGVSAVQKHDSVIRHENLKYFILTGLFALIACLVYFQIIIINFPSKLGNK